MKEAALKEIITDITNIIGKIGTVVSDHEQRLQLIEEADVKIELQLIAHRVQAISDKTKQTQSIQALNNLCEVFGISDLEITQK